MCHNLWLSLWHESSVPLDILYIRQCNDTDIRRQTDTNFSTILCRIPRFSGACQFRLCSFRSTVVVAWNERIWRHRHVNECVRDSLILVHSLHCWLRWLVKATCCVNWERTGRVRYIYIWFNCALHACEEYDRTGCVVAKTAADFIDEAALLKHQFARSKTISLGPSPEPEQGENVNHCPGRKEPCRRR